jgi:hypothetical protein
MHRGYDRLNRCAKALRVFDRNLQERRIELRHRLFRFLVVARPHITELVQDFLVRQRNICAIPGRKTVQENFRHLLI